MRILHVTPYYEQAWSYGGIPRAAAATVHALAQRGHDVTVCTTDAYLPDQRLNPAHHARLEHAPSGERPIEVRVFRNMSNAAAYHLQFFTPIGLGRYLRREASSFDIAHLHGCHHIPGAIAARLLRRANVPYVLTPHGTAAYIERRRLAKRLFDATLGRGVLAGASRVVAVSHAERTQLLNLAVPSSAIDVVPNPVALSEFNGTSRRGEFRRRLGLLLDTPLVLFLGKLTPRKRLDVLVEAFSQVSVPEARLVIAGNDMGYRTQLLAHIDRFGVAATVIVPGLLIGSERIAALTDADVVAYASEDEVFGLVAIEALLCRTPVIVSDDSGCGEVIREIGGGQLVPPGDVTLLRAAIENALTNRERWKQDATAAAVRARRYASETVCATLEGIYLDVQARAAATRMATA